MKNESRRMEYLCLTMLPGGPWFRLDFCGRREPFARGPYLSLQHWWPGGGRWHCVFFNGWKRKEAGG
jgi:hypothetical protein